MEYVTIIGTLIVLFGFLMYDKTVEKLVKHLKSENSELKQKVEKQQEIINTFYRNK